VIKELGFNLGKQRPVYVFYWHTN